MRWSEYIDADEVRKAIEVLQESGGVFEVRAIGTARKDILSGYFRDAETLLNTFDTIDMRQRNVYITLGKVKAACFARAQSEHFLKSPQTTSDTEIERYRWLFVDVDPVRPAGVSSSATELSYADDMAKQVLEYMRGLGFAEPVTAASGNGFHLLYRVDVPNDDPGHALIERCLKVLSAVFDSDRVKIDTTNSNPSRICKLHGTLAQKGRSTKERPHRMSHIIHVPDPIVTTDTAALERLASELPDEPVCTRPGGSGYQTDGFDLLSFMQKHGMTYTEDSNDRAKIYKLDECPFDPAHKDGDAKIFHYSNGAIAFKCHHNSCKDYKWQDVRLKYEPDAYDDKRQAEDERIDEGYRKHVRQKQQEQADQAEILAPEPQKPKKERKVRKLKSAEALMKKDLPDPVVFVGVDEELPILLEGTCILSAKPKLGKSWLALCMCIAVANGEDFLGYKTRKCSTLYLDLETSEQLQQKRLRKVLKGAAVPKNFYLETATDQIGDGFVEQIEAYLKEDPEIGIVVIDVFQIIRPPAKNAKENEYERAYRDITPLNELAQKHHISIILVSHDRKAVDPDDPFSNILGSTGLQGAATQMIVMFRKRTTDPIHIAVKGKTIDGLPDFYARLDNAEWSIVQGGDSEEMKLQQEMTKFMLSDVRKAAIAILEHNERWKGRCSDLVALAAEYGVGVRTPLVSIGTFFRNNIGRFMSEDGILVRVINNGEGSKIYEISKPTVDTVDETVDEPLMDFYEPSKQEALNVPFL